MKIKLFSLIAFGLFCGSIAYATPIEYIFTNASSFTLNGVSYTGPSPSFNPLQPMDLTPGGPWLTFTMQADTDNVMWPGNYLGLTLNPIGTTTVSFGGTTLATLTGSTSLLIEHDDIQLNGTNGEITGGLFGIYDGVSKDSAILEIPSGGVSSEINTDAGPLVITYDAYQGNFTAVLGTPSTVPEPSSILLLATGALGLAGVFRRRLFLN